MVPAEPRFIGKPGWAVERRDLRLLVDRQH
jgi:hypothetical protein